MKYIIIFLLLHGFRTAFSQPPAFKARVHKPGGKGYYFLFTFKMHGAVDTPNTCRMILDANGRCVYYKRELNGIDFKVQPNGLMSCHVDPQHKLFNSRFQPVDSVACVNSVKTDIHEFRVLPDGHYLLLGMEEVKMDLSKYPVFLKRNQAGGRNATVKSNVIQELDSDKKLVFEWHAKDHFAFDDMDTSYINDTAVVDWTHMNSIDRNSEGDYLVSSRNFNEITRINGRDGSVIWRLGGKKNEFAFANDSMRFSGQHDARWQPGARITFFDNAARSRSGKVVARGVEYEVNESGKSVKLVWSYHAAGGIRSVANGSVQRLKDSCTLINYGKVVGGNIMFEHVSARNEPVFDISFRDTLASYRAYYYDSLPFEFNRPHVSKTRSGDSYILSVSAKFRNYLWSNGSRSSTIKVKRAGEYSVYVPAGDGGFISSEVVVVPVVKVKMKAGR